MSFRSLHSHPRRSAEPQALNGAATDTGRFGRLYPGLPRLEVDAEILRRLASTMFESVRPSRDNECIPAAYTYFAQFVDHDLTFDATTVSEAAVDPGAVRNFRTPALDLDSVYGAGPIVQPWLYDRDDPDLLETGCLLYYDNLKGVYGEGIQADLPRSFSGLALIADPRNDENVIVAQLHLAFLHFHNEVVRWLRKELDAPKFASVFQSARSLVVRHYQWIVLHDLLPRLVDKGSIARARGRSMLAAGGNAFLPVEFSAAAYRAGHSTIRPVYNINRDNENATLQQLFENTGAVRHAQEGSKVLAPIDRTWIVDWLGLLGQRGDLINTLSRRIDPYLSDELSSLISARGANSLPQLNLLRGNSLRLPSGQTIAGFLRLPVLTPEQLSSGPDGEVIGDCGLLEHTPLWYYALKEAHCMRNGLRLGPVAGSILADVFLGLLQLDSCSLLSCTPEWCPVLPARVEGRFTLHDLLSFAGVLADNDEQDCMKARTLGLPAGRRFLPDAYVRSVRRT